MRVVISQPMYFPWVGFLEQLQLADAFVVYDDVQFSKGGFSNRVQAKTGSGSRWLTVPLREFRLGQLIADVRIDERQDWRGAHRAVLRNSYAHAPYVQDMLDLFGGVVDATSLSLAALSLQSMLHLGEYFSLNPRLRVLHAKELGVSGNGSQRVLDIVRALGGTEYITGHGARNYLNHVEFENAGISVLYMQYRCQPYPQLHGPFTPYVSALDLVANCGREGASYIQPTTTPWRSFLCESP